MIRCACLIVLNEFKDKILLVRVRDNEKWYFPGGKIELPETPLQTLVREIREELGIDLSYSPISYLTTIQGPAYGVDDTVELVCFTAKIDDTYSPLAEISEIGYIDWKIDRHLLAPAVMQLCDDWLANYINSLDI